MSWRSAGRWHPALSLSALVLRRLLGRSNRYLSTSGSRGPGRSGALRRPAEMDSSASQLALRVNWCRSGAVGSAAVMYRRAGLARHSISYGCQSHGRAVIQGRSPALGPSWTPSDRRGRATEGYRYLLKLRPVLQHRPERRTELTGAWSCSVDVWKQVEDLLSCSAAEAPPPLRLLARASSTANQSHRLPDERISI